MSEDSSLKNRFRSLLHNGLSLSGLAVAVIATAIGLPLLFVDMFTSGTNPYAGIFIYAILPGVATVGLAAAALGAFLERRRRKRMPGVPIPPFPRIDLNDPRHRLILVGSLAGLVVVIVLLSVTGYRAYNYTDSVQFCGEVCHGVMKPEYTAYQHSPHARVACVACHVGPGAGWYVHSKVSGAYQIYSVAFHKYPRPIGTPVHDLRPAQETCAQCHWPAKFFGAQQKTFNHYLADEKNTPWQIQMLLKIGGGDSEAGAASGIHWHMSIKNTIYYAATDNARQAIPYAKVVDPEGRMTEYMSTENPLTQAELAKITIRRMDCVDCHNRASHIFNSPDQAVSQALQAGQLDPSLPYVKREAMRLLAGSYQSEKQAQDAIQKELPAFYEKNYASVFQEKGPAIRRAITVVQALLAENVFPEMKTDWRAHPDHIGHLTSDGCFRCHDGLHKSPDGKVLTNACTACHQILAQGSPQQVANARLQAQSFRHPVDVGVDVTTIKCSTCHTGTTGL